MENNRWKSIFDADTFVQTLAYAMPDSGVCPGDGVMTGYGSVSGRLIFAGFQDIGYLGGAFGSISTVKIAQTIKMARKHGAPFILFIEASGTRLSEGLNALNGYGEMLLALNDACGEIPTICVIDGNCFGLCATIAGMFDFVIMTADNSFASVLSKEGPVSSNSAAQCAKEGFATFVCSKEDVANTILHFMDFLPDSAVSGTENYDGSQDDLNRPALICDQLQGNVAYDVRDVIADVADNKDWIELWSCFAPELVTGFARFGGRVVGILANQNSAQDGTLTIKACKKATAMIDFCDRFAIPLLTLTDCPGFADEDKDTQGDLIQASAMLTQAFSSTKVPKLNIIIGRAYGSALLLMNSKQIGADYVYAWDTAGISMVTPSIGALLESRKDIQTAEDPALKRSEVIEAYSKANCSPILAAQQGFVDDIIPAVQTRARIISFYQMI